MDLERRPGDSWLTRFAKDVGYGVAVDLTKMAVILIGVPLVVAFGLLVWRGGSVPAWLALLAVILVAVLLLALRARSVRGVRAVALATAEERDNLAQDLGICFAALERHETYSGHVAQALDALQRIVSGDIDVEIPYYIEAGVLEPARDLITDKPAEHIRLSVLIPRDDERWRMLWAAGHTVTGKAKYDQRIVDTLARHAYETGQTQSWEDVTTDSAFRQNPEATYPIRAMISIPLRWGEETLGVFNVVSSEPFAFDPTEATYLESLGAVISVAVGVYLKENAEDSPNSE